MPAPDKALNAARDKAGRLLFLDALRGVGALSVAVHHLANDSIATRFYQFTNGVFNVGNFGVLLFFLCSGFIIPASLERYSGHGGPAERRDAVRGFWIARFFRLFPIYWTVLLAAVILIFVLHDADYVDSIPLGYERVAAHPVPGYALNATMLPEFFNYPRVLSVSWTLAYELAFYALCSMFVLSSREKASPWLALGLPLAGGVIGVGATAGMLNGFPHALGVRPLAVALTGTALLALIFGALTSGRSRVLCIAGCLLLVPVVLNDRYGIWRTFTLLGLMFVGTTLYRWYKGEIQVRVAALVVAGFAVISGLVWLTYFVPEAYGVNQFRTWGPTLFAPGIAALALFCLALALRRAWMPPPLVFLGTISYSLYLVHLPLEHLIGPFWVGGIVGGEVDSRPSFVVWMTASLALSTVTYYALERPFHRLGQRLARPQSKSTVPEPIIEGRPLVPV